MTTDTPPSPASPFPIVGIGASAGGLAAFEAFFSGLPAEGECGMAFVLVQHLSPRHESTLAAFVQRQTRLPVLAIEDGMVVRPGHVYVVPPDHDLHLFDGRLELTNPSEHRLTIDLFFRSLAREQRHRAIGVVLSGTGTDGTSGARAIRGEGGLVVVQDPESAEFPGMPRSILDAALDDLVLAPAAMPAALVAWAARASAVRSDAPPTATVMPIRSSLPQVCALLRTRTGHDFSQEQATER